MASLTEIRTALKDTIRAAVPSLVCYDTVPDSPTLPAAVVMPVTGDFQVAMGRGTDTWELDVIVLVSTGDAGIGQTVLDGYVTGAGANSIRQTIFNDKALGLPETNAHVSGMTAYNLQYSAVQLDHIAATLRVVVHTPGKA